MASIELRNISKRYPDGTYGVREVDLAIEDGEFVILLGPSGCGKSTTLRMIAGLEGITEGEMRIGGRTVNRVAPRDRNVAVVFQSYALYPHMNVRDNMGFGLHMRGVPADRAQAKILEAAELLGLADLLNRKPAALSGGQRQRVALGRAIVRDPAAFLLDEPLSNLDAQLRAEMRLELVKLHRRLERTIVHVTHDQTEAMTMGDRICIMREGRLIQQGPPLEVYDNPANTFVAKFLATPTMNLLPAEVVNRDSSLQIDAGPGIFLPIPDRHRKSYECLVGRELIFGLRPEEFYASPRENPASKVKITVSAVETLGTENIVIGDVVGNTVGGQDRGGRREIAARLDRRSRPRIGETMDLYADLVPMHLFDRRTEDVVARESVRIGA